MTGDTWLALYSGKILGLADLEDHFTDSIRESQRQHQEDIWGGGGVLGSTKAVFTYAGSKLTLSVDREGWTGTGHRLLLDAGAAAWTSVPFANVGATVYYVGARHNDYPGSVETGADGLLAYGYTAEGVGEIGAPNVVAVVGSTLELTITTLVAPGWTVAGSRPVKVWLVDPASATYATAVYSGTASFTGGVVKVTVPNFMGQTTPSTTAADYQVLVEGPTVTTTDIRADTDYLFLGTVTSTAWDSTDQLLIDSIATWISAFLVQHQSSGTHKAITGDTLGLSGAGPKITTTSFDPGDDTQPHLRLKDSATIARFELYVDNGGMLRFPRSGAGAVVDVTENAAGNTLLSFTNARSATDYCDIEHDGLFKWAASKSGGTWGTEANLAGTPTYFLRNVGAGGANLNVETNLTVGGNADLGDCEVAGVGEFHFTTAHNLVESWPAWAGATVISGTLEVDTSTTPPKIRSGSDTVPVTVAIPLSGHWWKDGDTEQIVINVFSVMHRRAAAADAITATIYRASNGGAGARVVVATLTSSDTSGTWQITGMNTSGIAHTVLAANVYWVEITIDPNSARGDVEVECFNITAAASVVR